MQDDTTPSGAATAAKLGRVARLLASQAEQRAERRKQTLPLLVQMGAAAVAAEIETWAEGNEAVLAELGMERRSILRPVARWVPGAAAAAGRSVIGAERLAASVLDSIATVIERNKS